MGGINNDNRQKTILNWSSGKDAALSYYMLQQDNDYKVEALLTTVNAEQDRVVMHGVREELLDMQAARMQVMMKKVHLPSSPDHEVYNKAMQEVMSDFKKQGISHSAFGDIHLEDLKKYREAQLAQAGFKGVFPIWGMSTVDIVHMVEDIGLEAMIICVDERVLDKSYLGRKVDRTLLADLPEDVDPCGENGEFHTFVYNAPFFKAPIELEKGEMVRKTYSVNGGEAVFYFLDIYPHSHK